MKRYSLDDILTIFHKGFKETKTKKERLLLIKCYSKINYYKRNKHQLRVVRQEFDLLPKKKLYLKRCPICVKMAFCRHRHHIIQLQNGGMNIKKNIKYMCPHCHKKIHPWL